jgi:hypothetical protein
MQSKNARPQRLYCTASGHEKKNEADADGAIVAGITHTCHDPIGAKNALATCDPVL